MVVGVELSWSAKQYVAFEDERTRPVRDLLAALPQIQARSVIDLGCGPGNSTEALAAHFPVAEISGIDSSPDMIQAAQRRLPGVRFRVLDIDAWCSEDRRGEVRRSNAKPGFGPFGVILANAVLQWLPNHAQLLPALVGKLASGGALAVQMPDNLDEPAHRLMREVGAARAVGRQTCRGRRGAGRACGRGLVLRIVAAAVRQGRCVANHLLSLIAGRRRRGGGVVQGQRALAFLGTLGDAERAAYLAQYTGAISRAYPALADGSVLLPFPQTVHCSDSLSLQRRRPLGAVHLDSTS